MLFLKDYNWLNGYNSDTDKWQKFSSYIDTTKSSVYIYVIGRKRKKRLREKYLDLIICTYTMVNNQNKRHNTRRKNT